MICFALVFALDPVAWADMHWATNGTHSGVLVASAAPDGDGALDGRNIPGGHEYIGRFTLAYALWTIGGEPVHEFIFTWGWRTNNLVVAMRDQRTITTGDLARYPDLLKWVFELKPVSLTLQTAVDFYDTNGVALAHGRKNVTTLLLEQAGAQDTMHAPGSPRWADFFDCNDPDHPSRDELDRRHNELFRKSARIELTTPRITSVSWPEASLKFIADEFLRREALEQRQTADALAWEQSLTAGTNIGGTTPLPSNPSEPTPHVKSGQDVNPLELARRTATAQTENPFERALRLEREKAAQPAGTPPEPAPSGQRPVK